MMKENSQIAFDFFTPPSKKPGSQVPGDPAHERNGGDPAEDRNTGESVHDINAVYHSEESNAGDSADERNVGDEEPIDLGYIPIVSSSRTSPPVKTRGRKSLKSYDAASAYTEVPPDEILFQKQYYPIGEVSQMFKVNASLLRYWESEFDILKPRKNKKGDRHFRPEDIKNLELIYDLLRRRKLTIDGARNFLKKNKTARERYDMIRSLQQMRSFLLELKASL